MDCIPLPTSVWQMAQGVWYRTTRDKYGVRIHPGLPERSSLVSNAFSPFPRTTARHLRHLRTSPTSPTSPGVSQNLPKSPEISRNLRILPRRNSVFRTLAHPPQAPPAAVGGAPTRLLPAPAVLSLAASGGAPRPQPPAVLRSHPPPQAMLSSAASGGGPRR